MYKDVLRAIEGIDYLPAIGIVIFMTFFLIWLWQVAILDKSEIASMEHLPLDDATIAPTVPTPTSTPNSTAHV
ncbi:MAG: cbb3-type cytochrome c oxidase subunit 3 [Bernardetiaceae bacterium]